MNETAGRYAEYEFVIGDPIPLAAAGSARMVNMQQTATTSSTPSGKDRATVIGDAYYEFQVNKGKRGMFCNRDVWINGALVEAGMKPLDDAEQKLIDSPGQEKVAAVTNRAGQEWDQQGASLQRLCSREAFIQESLHEAGLVRVVA